MGDENHGSYTISIGGFKYHFLDPSEGEIDPILFYDVTNPAALETIMKLTLDMQITLKGNFTQKEEVLTVREMRKEFAFSQVLPRPYGLVSRVEHVDEMFKKILKRDNGKSIRVPRSIDFGKVTDQGKVDYDEVSL